jgi:hypothetical protein
MVFLFFLKVCDEYMTKVHKSKERRERRKDTKVYTGIPVPLLI